MDLRPEQLTQLAQAVEQSFQNRLADHLGRNFPGQLASLDRDGVRRFAEQAIEKARAWGMRTEQDIAKYADVMSAFGRDFDRNALTSWASSILNDPALADAGAKVNRLAQEALSQARALEAQAEQLRATGQQALEGAAAGLASSARELENALQQAAEDFPQNLAGNIVQGCQFPAPPKDLCMGKGFADPALIENYLKDFKSQVLQKWDQLKPDERFEAVKKLQEKQFKDLGIPVPDITRSVDQAAGWLDPSKLKPGEDLLFGIADAQSWGMTLNGYLFEQSPLSQLDQKELAKTLLHESRHIEQYFKAAQQRAAEGLGDVARTVREGAEALTSRDAGSEAMGGLSSDAQALRSRLEGMAADAAGRAQSEAEALRSRLEGAAQDAMRTVQSEAEALRSHLEGAAQDAMRTVQSEADALRNKVETQMAELMRTVETARHKAMDIPQAVLQEAVKNPLPQVSGQTGAECENFKKAKEWLDAKWGKGPLSQYNLPYADRPLEKDAFGLEEIVDRKW